ncbi:MAG: alpha/beta fold hydrolase [Polyangiaceae bacterium]
MAKVEGKRDGWLGTGDPSTQRVAGNAPAILALHGFGGTPVEVELLMDVARGLGLQGLAPVLPGHGTHPDDLAQTRFSDWLRGAEQALSELYTRGNNQPLCVAGLSMGSLLALELALRHPERVRCLVLMANALWLRSPFPARALDWAGRLRLPDFQLPKLASDLGDPVMRKNHLTYASQPVHAAVDLQRAARRIESRLSEVRCPTFLVHGAQDRLCPAKNADLAARAMSRAETQVLILPRSRHIVTRDIERRELERRLADYLQEKLELPDQPGVQTPVEP